MKLRKVHMDPVHACLDRQLRAVALKIDWV